SAFADLLLNRMTLTKKRGFKPPFLKGIIKKMSDFKLRPFKAEPIQNHGRYLRSEETSDPRAPKSKIQNRVTGVLKVRGQELGAKVRKRSPTTAVSPGEGRGCCPRSLPHF
ncbi:MAG TPA: hypothetical protein V6C90_16875, partial [Coleofasciculaceae cyanobacterium]